MDRKYIFNGVYQPPELGGAGISGVYENTPQFGSKHRFWTCACKLGLVLHDQSILCWVYKYTSGGTENLFVRLNVHHPSNEKKNEGVWIVSTYTYISI